MVRRVVVFGASGMLGGAVMDELRRDVGVEAVPVVRGTGGRPHDIERDRHRLQDLLADVAPDVVVNCAGVLAADVDEGAAGSIARALAVNALFPQDLARLAERDGFRVVHVSTDGVFDRRAGRCDEDATDFAVDVYGSTKRLGESPSPSVLNLRCSIIGRSPQGRGLVEWCRSRPRGAVVRGFDDHAWNGLTTMELARTCRSLVDPATFDGARAENGVHHLFRDPPVTKAQLVALVSDVLDLGLRVEPTSSGAAVTRTLASRYDSLQPSARLPLDEALAELAEPEERPT